MLIRVLDFETTGMTPEQGAQVCEYGFVDVDSAHHNLGLGFTGLVRVDNWSIEAQAIHHITKAEVDRDGVPWEVAKEKIAYVAGHGGPNPEPVPVFAAHNADYEKQFFNPPGSVWIDTYKVALRIWPEAPSHSNQGLRYWLGLELGEEATPPHRALPDAIVTAHILICQLRAFSVEDLARFSVEPPYLTTVPFGKHKGRKWEDVPMDYLRWLSRQNDLRPGVMEAIQRTSR